MRVSTALLLLVEEEVEEEAIVFFLLWDYVLYIYPAGGLWFVHWRFHFFGEWR